MKINVLTSLSLQVLIPGWRNQSRCGVQSHALRRQPRSMGDPKGAPVNPPSTTNSIALMYDESSEARKSTAFASSSASPHRPKGNRRGEQIIQLGGLFSCP